jgi:hypothetical protein
MWISALGTRAGDAVCLLSCDLSGNPKRFFEAGDPSNGVAIISR